MKSELVNKLKIKYPKLYIKYINQLIIFNPENETNNIEYKKTLVECDDEKMKNYANQMERRMGNSSRKTAKYIIGIMDNGDVIGLSDNDIMISIEKIIEIIKYIGAAIIALDIINIEGKNIIMIGIKKKKLRFNTELNFDLI